MKFVVLGVLWTFFWGPGEIKSSEREREERKEKEKEKKNVFVLPAANFFFRFPKSKQTIKKKIVP